MLYGKKFNDFNWHEITKWLEAKLYRWDKEKKEVEISYNNKTYVIADNGGEVDIWKMVPFTEESIPYTHSLFEVGEKTLATRLYQALKGSSIDYNTNMDDTKKLSTEISKLAKNIQASSITATIVPDYMKSKNTLYFKGDLAQYTGKYQNMYGKYFYEIELLEGHMKGDFRWVPTPPENMELTLSVSISDIKREIKKFVKQLQHIRDLNDKKHLLSSWQRALEDGRKHYTTYGIQYGKKYARIYTETSPRDRSVFCFVDITNGDILKAASWKVPTKHSRGNIFDSDPQRAVDLYGANI